MHNLKSLVNFALFDQGRQALCDEKFSQIEGNGQKSMHIELSNTVIKSNKFSYSVVGPVPIPQMGPSGCTVQ